MTGEDPESGGADDSPSGDDSPSADDSPSGDDWDESGSDSVRDQMEQALRAIRREGWKAACIYAIVDGVAVLLAVNLTLSVLEPSWTPESVTVVSSVPSGVATTLDVAGPVSIPGEIQVGAGVAGVVLVGEFVWRVRQPLVERFEAGNPAVAEALRTARDAVRSDADSPMARRLYEDVLDGLQETSSVALLDLRRVSVTVVLVLVLSVVSVQAAVYDVSVGNDANLTDDTADREENVTFSGLQDGESVLGESEVGEVGDENLTAEVESTRGDEETETDEDRSDVGGPAGGGGGANSGIEGQQAGFDRQEDIEDAQLVREYNVRIRDQQE